MGFRTVVIKSRAKLEFRLDSLIVRSDKEHRIFLKEINTLIVQNTAVSLTAALLSELSKQNVKVIFCDEKCNPSSELLPYYGAHNCSGRLREQLGWSDETKKQVWREIIRAKITAQCTHLLQKGFDEQASMLAQYAAEVADGDATNREGHAAKVYFNSLLGGVSRRDESPINKYLNYGYSVILSAFNREIVAAGYLTQIGIWHANEFNQFNLGCDLMEPFRVFSDIAATEITEEDDFKTKMIDVLNRKTTIEGKETIVDVAVKTCCQSVFRALRSGDVSDLCFPEKYN